MSANEKIEKRLKSYALYVNNFECSPFELIEMLHIRDSLQEDYTQMNTDEKLQLTLFDTQLIFNSRTMVELLSPIFDFDGAKPSDGWWWDLKLVAEKLNQSLPKFDLTEVMKDVV